MSKKTKFHFRINGGPEQTIKIKSGVYINAVAAIPAFFDVDFPFDVEIWVPDLLPDYGPYLHRISDYGGRVETLVRI